MGTDQVQGSQRHDSRDCLPLEAASAGTVTPYTYTRLSTVRYTVSWHQGDEKEVGVFSEL